MENVLNQDQLSEIKQILENKIQNMSTERQEKLYDIKNYQDGLKDAADIASYESEVEKIQWHIEKNRIYEQKSITALNRLKNGIYGYCNECDSPISYKRLKIDPTSELCIHCKSEMEDGV